MQGLTLSGIEIDKIGNVLKIEYTCVCVSVDVGVDVGVGGVRTGLIDHGGKERRERGGGIIHL